jgi:hypothetical protein
MDHFYQQKLINEKNHLQRQLIEAERKLKSLTEQVSDYEYLVSLLKEGIDLQEITAFTDVQRAANPNVRALEVHQAKRLRNLMHSANRGTLQVRSVRTVEDPKGPENKVVAIDNASKAGAGFARSRLAAMGKARGLNVGSFGNQMRLTPEGHPVGSVVDTKTKMSLQGVPEADRAASAENVNILRKNVHAIGRMADRQMTAQKRAKNYSDSLTIEEGRFVQRVVDDLSRVGNLLRGRGFATNDEVGALQREKQTAINIAAGEAKQKRINAEYEAGRPAREAAKKKAQYQKDLEAAAAYRKAKEERAGREDSIFAWKDRQL